MCVALTTSLLRKEEFYEAESMIFTLVDVVLYICVIHNYNSFFNRKQKVISVTNSIFVYLR